MRKTGTHQIQPVMKLTIFTSLFAFILSTSISAQGEFVRIYDELTDNTSVAYSVKSTADGGFICIGSTNGDKDPDIFMIKTGESAGAQWARQCSGPDKSMDVALDIVPTSDGGYVFCGNSETQRVLWKVDSEGEDVWKRHFGERGMDAFSTIIETQDGGIITAGDGMMITKTDTEGNELWTRNKPTDHLSAYRAIKELPNGDLLIGGFFTARDEGKAITILVKTDSNGKAQWAESYGAGMINSIDVDKDGNILVAGNASYTVPIVLKIAPDGKAIWEGVYEDSGLGSAHTIVATSSDKTLVFSAGGYFEINSEGRLKNKEVTQNYAFNKAIVTGNGEMILAGFSSENISGKEKFAFMKVGKSGFPSPSASLR